MRKTLTLLLLCWGLVACTDDAGEPGAPVLSTETTTVNFPEAGGSKTLGIRANTHWTVQCDGPWWVSRQQGYGDYTLTLTAQENPRPESITGRLTLSATGVPPVEVTLTQLGAEPLLLLSPQNITLDADEATATIEITTNVAYEFAIGDPWLRVVSHENNILRLQAEANPSEAPRATEVVFTGAHGVAAQTATLTQQGASPSVRVVGSDTRTVEKDATRLTIEIEATGACEVSLSGAGGWLSQYGDAQQSGRVYTYTFDLTENTGNDQRKATLTFAREQHPEIAATVSILQKGLGALPEITVNPPAGGYAFDVRQWIRIPVDAAHADSYSWSLHGTEIASGKDLLHVLTTAGTYSFRLTATNQYGAAVADIPVTIHPRTDYDSKVTAVFDFLPAPGQFTNKMPVWAEGDTQTEMNAKALAALRSGAISLGGFGGYVVMGFDHVLVNTPDAYDFRIKGNAMDNWSEPGVVMVSCDANGNGLPDDEWFEIAGSAYNDPNTDKDYEITYTLAQESPEMIITWTDSQGNYGEIRKNGYHGQSYFPQWLTANTYSMKGTRLTEEGVYDTSGNGTYWVSMPFAYGYVDNCVETQDCSKIDLDWAVGKHGQPVKLAGIDFIRVHTGMNIIAGWLGEISTEIYGFEEFNRNNN
jgi:hypothetical protein